MKLRQIAKVLEAEVINSPGEDVEVKMGCGSDLMSDVLLYTKPGSMLLTGLTNIQVIYTASAAGITAVCFVRGKRPFEDTIDLANRKKIALLTTELPMFEACGRLYKGGLTGGSEPNGVSAK